MTVLLSFEEKTDDAEIWSLKASDGRIAACASLCKFSEPFKSFVEFLRFSLISIMSLGKEQTIDSQHLLLFSVVLNISKVSHRKNTTSDRKE